MSEEQIPVSGLSDYQYGFSYPDQSVYKPAKGLSEEVVRNISAQKNEPEWMLEFRLRALRAFHR
ncbi:MAG: Fe-S cluster assembly protein SufB, partial [Spirochaetaceae bacterium]|nr:Fe-S cluster assembly protein SufB [Spirochaetaceae bacterium]